MHLKEFKIDELVEITPSAVQPTEARRQVIIERLGVVVRCLRKSRNLSIAELATLSGVSESSISRIEAGQSEPGAYTLLCLDRAMGVKGGFLLATAS